MRKKGEVVVIVGPSGCGKSTFLRCLNLLESIDGGKIYLKGMLLNQKMKVSRVREKIGMVFQSYDLFPHMTIWKNVLLAPKLVQKRIKKKQRAAIVRALLMNPEILLLDEITAALDPEMVREVVQVVLELAKKEEP